MKRAVTILCVVGMTIGLLGVCLRSTSAAEGGRKLGPLTKLLIDKGAITREELELEDAVFEPTPAAKGSVVERYGGIVTSLLKKKGAITQDELDAAIKEAVSKGEVGTKGSPLVGLLMKRNVITEDEATRVLKALGITPPEKPAPAPAPEEAKPAEEKPAEEAAPPVEGQPAAPTQPETPAAEPSAPAP